MIELYSVTTVVKKFRYRNQDFENVGLWWVANEGGTGSVSRFGVPYADLVKGYDDSSRGYADSAVDECFTADEAKALKEYLDRENGHEGETVIEPLSLPFESNIAGQSANAIGGGRDCLLVWERDGYPLPFKAEAYFDVTTAQRADP
jgi:hypothetical protein